MQVKIEPGWGAALADEFAQPYFAPLIEFVKQEYAAGPVYPPGGLIFNAFQHCPFDKVKVVVLGQDPYHGRGQAHGLSFSVPEGIAKPPSLHNIFKEIAADVGAPPPASGNLERWADQGVLLLNATLTVRASQAGSHQGHGWETFTDAVIRKVSEGRAHVVFILWGGYAQKKAVLIDAAKHLILKSAHPSPFAADKGFFGSRPFSQTNAWLEAHGEPPINW
ncbi:MAG: uracil-DNA glycosylase [Hymenobacteraceae bacterium]|nr:uracil-DNA glycosylase [Hymenobacteraceae bacterium]